MRFWPHSDNAVYQESAKYKVVNHRVGVYILPQIHVEPCCMTTISENKRHTSKLKFLLTLLMHQFIGTLGVLILAGMLTAIAFEFPNPWGRTVTMHDFIGVLREMPYFPVQVVVALLLGWLVSELFEHESMLWIWVLPYAWLVYDFVRLPTISGMTFQERFSHFFGWGCRPESHCIDQTGVTLPFYAAVAYSIGALLARKLPMGSPATRRKISVVVFTVGVLILADGVKGTMFHFKYYLALVPQAWQWIVIPAIVLDIGIGVCIIILALKLRRTHRDFAARDPLR